MLHTSILVQRGASGLPCAMALRLIRFRPGDRLSCHPPSLEAFASRKVDASTEASDPNDFAVRICRARQSQHPRPSLPCPAFATMADAPLVEQDGRNCRSDLPDGLSVLFSRRGLDRFFLICPSGYYVAHSAVSFLLRDPTRLPCNHGSSRQGTSGSARAVSHAPSLAERGQGC